MDPEEFEEVEEFEEFEELEAEEFEELEEPADPPQAKQPSRSQARIEALDRKAAEAEARAELLQRQVTELLAGRTNSEAEARQRQRQVELEAMDPWDRAEALNRDREARMESRLGAVTRTLQDSTDQAKFASLCASNPRIAKLADEVEARLAEARSRGIDVQRETLATFILGEKALKGAGKARTRAEKKAEENLSRERSRPAGGPSGEPRSQTKDERAAYEKRLNSYKF